MFWSIISHKKQNGTFSVKDFVALLPRGDKGKVSKWFNGDPNWTLNTIGTIAHALNVELRVEAVDRSTGIVFTPAGVQDEASRRKTVTWAPPNPNSSVVTATVNLGPFASPRTSSDASTKERAA
jgi:hypothetical protein